MRVNTPWLTIYAGQMLVPTMMPVDDPLRIVTTAVTPVVMVSATAILISGVNARYISISDRMRMLSAEFRREPVSAARRANIKQQMFVFIRRMVLVEWATRILYIAVAAFVSMALLISLSVRHAVFELVTLPLFLLGLTLVLLAIILQSVELRHSIMTIRLETAEVISEDEPPSG
ncbi:MAG TPA: DUF2721 domain-containing protein [Acidisarcina sp.]